MTFVSEGLLIVATVYSFEFAQSYFRPTEIWDWFAQSWIRPLSSFIIWALVYNSTHPVLNSPSEKRAKIKRGQNFSCIQYLHMVAAGELCCLSDNSGCWYTLNIGRRYIALVADTFYLT